MTLSAVEITLLRTVRDKGGSLALGQKDRALKEVARKLLGDGHLAGTAKSLRITAQGLAAIPERS